jgi:tRNA nucleotidyltransferase (CCA-adding enzyme)
VRDALGAGEGKGIPSRERRLVTALAAAGCAAAEARLNLYVVGGALRDLLLRRSPEDLDLAVETSAESALFLAQRLGALPDWRLGASHRRFGTATLTAPVGLRVDLAATRTETYPRPASLPVVLPGAPIAEDLRRRDFTIHAMARPVAVDGSLGPLLDPFGGKEDVVRRLVRLLHARSLADDPTRALRAVRYAARLGFRVDRGFRPALALARAEGAFEALSGDRLRRGLEEVLGENDFGRATELLLDFGLLDDICPGWGDGLKREISLKGRKRRPDEESAGQVLATRWAQLLLGLSPSKKKSVADRLKFSRALRGAAGVPLK